MARLDWADEDEEEAEENSLLGNLINHLSPESGSDETVEFESPDPDQVLSENSTADEL